MNIKQIVNLASFYAKKVKNGEFRPNRAKQEKKSANQNSFTRLKNNQKAEYPEQIKPQFGLNGLRGARFAIVVMKKTGWHLMIQIFVQYVRIDFLRMLQQKDVPYAG